MVMSRSETGLHSDSDITRLEQTRTNSIELLICLHIRIQPFDANNGLRNGKKMVKILGTLF